MLKKSVAKQYNSFMIKYFLLICVLVLSLNGKDTLVPISDPKKIPTSAIELWKNYDPHAEPLEVKIIKEWKTNEVTTRYITYHVGRFKGSASRVAAYYSFPNQCFPRYHLPLGDPTN